MITIPSNCISTVYTAPHTDKIQTQNNIKLENTQMSKHNKNEWCIIYEKIGTDVFNT